MKTDFKRLYNPAVLNEPDVKKRLALLSKIATKIRATLPKTEGELTWSLREFKADDVRKVLHTMAGKRVGRDTDGEVVISGYQGGSEVYALRSATKRSATSAPKTTKRLINGRLVKV